MTQRTEAEIVTRAGLPVVLGGVAKRVPPLTIGANRRWKELVVATVREQTGASLASLNDWNTVAALLVGATDMLLDLLLAYDETSALGGREWIEAHATDEEVYAAFKVVATAAFPFARDAGRFPSLIAEVLKAVPASSTSSPSPSGGTPREPSTRS